MNRLVFSKEAKKDLGDIWKYTFYKWSEAQADKYYRHLVEACKEISKTPSLGKSYDMILDGLYDIKYGRHIIFYRSNRGQNIEIIRVLHNSMDRSFFLLP